MPCRHSCISCASGAACLVKRAAQIPNLGITALSSANERAVEHGQTLHTGNDLMPRVRVHLNDRVARQPGLNQRRILVQCVDG